MIGIFDSGVGGLSVFREIKKLLPEEKYIYFSDNAHCPYGEKSKEYIIDRARIITDFLLEQGADIIVLHVTQLLQLQSRPSDRNTHVLSSEWSQP